MLQLHLFLTIFEVVIKLLSSTGAANADQIVNEILGKRQNKEIEELNEKWDEIEKSRIQKANANLGPDEDEAVIRAQIKNDIALERARAEARTPGAQFGGSLLDAARAEKELVQAGEVTNQEVMGAARMLYGTGLRAY